MGIRVNIGANIDAKAVTDALNDLLSQWENTTDRMKRQINEALGGKSEKVVEIQYEVDDSGLKKAVAVEKERYSVLDDLRKQYEKENKVQEGSLTNLRQRLNTATQLRDSTAKYVREAQNGVISGVKINDQWAAANLKVQELRSALQQANSSSFFDRIKDAFDDSGVSRFFQGLQGVVQAFQAVAIIVQQVTAAFDTFVSAQKKIQGLDLTFRSIGQGAEGGARAFAAAAGISQNLGVSLDTTLNGFKQLTPVILNSGGSMDDVAKITESLSSRFVAFGKSADESKRILNAVIQAFGKGKLQAEELNQQISEADPAFRTDLATAIGVTTAELEQMVKNGKITAAMLIDILPKMNKTAEIFKLGGLSAEEAARSIGMLDEAGNKIGPTLEQISNKINTVNQLTLIKVSEEFDKLIKAVFTVQAAFADFFSNVANSSAFEALADLIGDLALGFANVISVILKVTDFLIGLLEPVGEAIKAFSDLSLGGTKLGEVLGTLVAIGLAAWFAKSTAEAISNTVALVKQGLEIAGNILGRGREATATGVATAAVNEHTRALLANTAAQNANTLAGSAGAAGDALSGLKALPPAANAASTALSNVQRIVPVTVKDLGAVGGAASTAAGGMKLLPPAAGSAAGAMKALPPATSLWGQAMQALQGILNGFKGALGSIANAIKGGFTAAITSIGGLLKGGFTGALNLGSKALTGIGTAFKAIGPFINTALGAFAKFAVGLGKFFTGPIGLALLAIASVGAAIATWKTAFGGADAANKQYGAGVSSLNKILEANKAATKAQTGEQEKAKNSWESSVKTVGVFQAGLDRVRSLVGLATAQQAQNTQTIAGGARAYEQFQSKVAQVDAVLKTQLATMGDDVDKKKQAKETLTALNSETNNQIATEKKNLEALKARLPADKQDAEQVKTLINLTHTRIKTMEAQIKAREKEAAAAGLSTQATLDEVEALKKALEIQKLREALVTQKNTAIIEEAKAKWEAEKEAIEQAEEKITTYYDKQKQKIKDTEMAEQRRHDLVKRGLEDEKLAVEARYDAQINAIKEAEAASKQYYDAELQRLRDPTASEKIVKEMEVAELQRQAASALTNEERVRARAQLERIEADKQAAELEKRRAAEEKARKEQEAQLEKQKAAELEAIKKREREEDRAHQDRMYAAQVESNNLQKAEAAERKKLKDQEAAAAEKYGPIIKQAEQEIQAEKAKTEAAQVRVKAAEDATKGKIEESTSAQKAHTTAIGESADAIRTQLIKNLDDYAAKIRNLPKIPPAPSSTNFAGGHVGPGLVGTVNELGKEAFLSDSGKLSWINKPAWSKWVAPSSGTIIPSHIAAGLDIPSGGVNINRSTVRTVTNTANGSMNYRAMARAIGAAVQGNAGTVNNNVVINSDRPVQAASDMLVQMTKIKRNRYS